MTEPFSVPDPDPELRPPEPFVAAQPWSADGEVAEPAADVEPPELPADEVVTELSDDERLLFNQLLTVGQRSKSIDVFGHTVVIQSLRVSDDLRIGLWCRPHEGSKMEHRATQVAVCAAGIRSIDGVPLYQSLTGSESEDAVFEHKAEVVAEYYPVTITQIYRGILELDEEFAQLARTLGKLKG